MTVQELIKALQKLKPNMMVALMNVGNMDSDEIDGVYLENREEGEEPIVFLTYSPSEYIFRSNMKGYTFSYPSNNEASLDVGFGDLVEY